MEILQQIESKTLTNGGCTYAISFGEFIEEGYPLYGLSLHKELEEIIPKQEFDSNRLRGFILKHSELLWQPNVALGTWEYEGSIYLDVTTLFDKLQTSLEELKSYTTDQIAAWDFETFKDIKL